jgi:hypothetical protein
MTAFIEHFRNVTTNNYNAVANSHTLQFTTTRTKSSQSAVAAAWYRLPTADFPRTLGFRFSPYFSHQLLTATAHKDSTAAVFSN